MTVQYQGVWSLQSAAQLQSTQRWVTDPLFDYTTLLLQADDAANGAQNNTFLDSSSNAFAITRNGNTTQGTFTPFSSQPGAWSNFFGGSTDYIAFTSIAAYGVGTGNFSVQTFVNFNSISGNQRIFCLGASGTDGINVQFAGSTTQLQLDIANTRIITHTWTPVVGTWYQIDVVRAGTGTNQTTLYINGLSVATGTSSGSVGQNAANIGGLSWNSSFTVNGYVSNVRFSNTARSISAVTTNYSSDANTLLLTAQSNRFVDNSSTGNTFTIGGTPSVQAFSPFAPQFQWTPSVIGGSGYFDGTGDYLSAASNTALTFGTGDFTVEGWFYANSIPTQPTILNNGSDAAGLVITMVSSKIYAYFVGAGNVFGSGGATIVPNTWYHFAWVRSGSTHTFYLNGAVYGATYSSAGNHSSTGGVGIGYSVAGTVFNAWNGYIANVRMVKGTAVYTGAFTPPIAPVTTSGPASSYSSTTNVNTTFTSTNTSLLLNFTNAGIYDGTMKNNLETVGNAQISTAVVKYGSGSMAFDGSGDYLRPNSGNIFNFGTGDFTVEFWLYLNSTGNQTFIDCRPGSAGDYMLFDYSSNALRYYVGSTTVITGSSLSTGQWYHIALSRISGTARMFINGTQTGSTATHTTNLLSSSNPYIASNYVPGDNLNGYIDDLRVTRGIARYTQNFIPPSVALPRQ